MTTRVALLGVHGLSAEFLLQTKEMFIIYVLIILASPMMSLSIRFAIAHTPTFLISSILNVIIIVVAMVQVPLHLALPLSITKTSILQLLLQWIVRL